MTSDGEPQPYPAQDQPPPTYGPPAYGPPAYGPPPGYGAPPAYGPPPGYPPPPGYGAPPYGYPMYPPQSRGTNGLAIASMVLGILWIYWLGSILALIFGYVARSQIKKSGQSGGGMALAGIILGWIGIATMIVVIIVAISLSQDHSSESLLPLLQRG